MHSKRKPLRIDYNELDKEVYNALIDIIIEDIERVGLRNFIEALLKYIDIDKIAMAISEADERRAPQLNDDDD